MSPSGFTWVNMGFKIPRLFVSRKEKAGATERQTERETERQQDKQKESQTAPGRGALRKLLSIFNIFGILSIMGEILSI